MKQLLSLLLALGLSASLALPACALEVEDAKELLKTYYVDPLPEQFDEMDDLDAILDAINDPYTCYLSAEEYAQLQTSINGQTVVGIGASIHLIFENGYRILSVLPDSPAQEAGLEAGDVILSVDGHTLTDTDDAAGYIRGQEGTSVALTIRKNSTGRVYKVTLIRKSVQFPIVTYEMAGDALVIQCDSFGDSTASGFYDALTEFEDAASVCIVDLRSNPGGTSTAAAGSAGLFLDGAMISYFRDADADYNYVYKLPTCPDLFDKPVIVLTSSYSASGSEMFAAAIRDYDAGISIGQRTFGKGVAQYVFDETTSPDLFDGDCLKITVYRFFSPNGATNDTIGVLPTLVISSENTPAVALMLSGSAPKQEDSASWLKLELCGQTFYIDADRALSEDTPAFCELLEALPPSAVLYKSSWPNAGWEQASPNQIVYEYGLTLGVDYTPRGFSDCDGSPYVEEIHTLSAYQLVSGYGNQIFDPHRTITRAEFCAMVSPALSLSSTDVTNSFTDVPDTAWYAGAVNAMAHKGFISGYGDGTFHPDSNITYEEIVTILANVSVWANMDGFDYAQMELAGQATETYKAFHSWAQIPARNLDLFGALLPDAVPSNAATREEAAASLCRLMDGCGLLWH